MADEDEAKKLIARATATRNPFDEKYSQVVDEDWESCSMVLNAQSVREMMERQW